MLNRTHYFLLAISALGLTACNREPAHPTAGQIVKPALYGAGGTSESPDPTDMSLYEYSDKFAFLITGKSILFSMPKYFTTFTANRDGGPQSSIHLRYIPEGNRAYALRFYSSNEAWKNAEASVVDISLTSYEKDPPSTINEVLAGKSNELMDGLMDRPFLEIQPTMFCSNLVLTRIDPIPPNDERHAAPNRGSRNKGWPFQEAVVFARPDGASGLKQLITCSKFVLADGFPLCATRSDFRGWPMRMLFSGSRVCHADELISHSRTFLDRFVSRETPRGPDMADTRHSDSHNR